MQARVVEMISGLKGRSYYDKLNKLGSMSLEQRRTRFDMIMTYKILHGFNGLGSSTWFRKGSKRGHDKEVSRPIGLSENISTS